MLFLTQFSNNNFTNIPQSFIQKSVHVGIEITTCRLYRVFAFQKTRIQSLGDRHIVVYNTFTVLYKCIPTIVFVLHLADSHYPCSGYFQASDMQNTNSTHCKFLGISLIKKRKGTGSGVLWKLFSPFCNDLYLTTCSVSEKRVKLVDPRRKTKIKLFDISFGISHKRKYL